MVHVLSLEGVTASLPREAILWLDAKQTRPATGLSLRCTGGLIFFLARIALFPACFRSLDHKDGNGTRFATRSARDDPE